MDIHMDIHGRLWTFMDIHVLDTSMDSLGHQVDILLSIEFQTHSVADLVSSSSTPEL